jgi:hypothetical protein
MSTDYLIFIQNKGSIEEYLRLLNNIEGVSCSDPNQIEIEGLLGVRCFELNDRSRMIMREDYGPYGLDVNWEIRGQRDEDCDIFELIIRLYQCMAKIVNKFPMNNCSLMRNGEDFYLFNTSEQLVISDVYYEILPNPKALFQKEFVVRERF